MRLFKWTKRKSTGEIILYSVVSLLFLVIACSYIYILLWAVIAGCKTHSEIALTPFSLPKEWHLEHFVEVFQLLDRKTEIRELVDDGYPIGTSEYGITNANIARIVYGNEKHKVRIPSNLSIIGTMNTSDQNVFTLDNAFQRRWEMRLIESNFEHVDRRLAEATILDTGISWEVFCTQINKIIVGNNARMTSAEDKRLGAYFVHLKDLVYNPGMGDLSSREYEDLRTKEQNKNDGNIKDQRESGQKEHLIS